jgi:hypothetical protein
MKKTAKTFRIMANISLLGPNAVMKQQVQRPHQPEGVEESPVVGRCLVPKVSMFT